MLASVDQPRNPFGIEYESRLIASLLHDRHFFHAYLAIFTPQYLTSAIHSTCCEVIQAFKDQYNRPPDQMELEIVVNEWISQKYNADKAVNELALFKREMDDYWRVTPSEMEFVITTALKYVQQRACEIAMLKGARMIGTEEACMIPQLLADAVATGTRLTSFGTDYFQEAKRRAMLRYSTPRETNRLPFYIPKFDTTIGGVGFRRLGSGIPELLMFGGGANKGKSRCIAHMAKVGMSLGEHGLICSSEMAEDLYSERLDMSLGLMDTTQLYDPSNFLKLQKRIELFARQGGKCFIKKYPAGSTTIDETLVLARLIEATLGIDLTWIAWDYTGEFRARNQKAERRDQLAEIVRSQKAACDELECAGIGAFQLNREGSRSEMAQLEHAAEDITVARVADTVIVIAQTDEEEAMEAPEMRWCARKVRSMERNQTVRLLDDKRRMRFIQHPEEVTSRECLTY